MSQIKKETSKSKAKAKINQKIPKMGWNQKMKMNQKNNQIGN